MTEMDPSDTQHEAIPSVTSELAAAGFGSAQVVGRGGFGVVYRCTQASLDRTVAVKVLTNDLVIENRNRFFREQRAMGLLSGHPNIVNVLQVGVTARGQPFIVMPYYPDGSLDARIRQSGPLSILEVQHLGVRLAGALEAAHHLGIVHRDIKPANILLTGYGEPCLTDFGIAHIPGGFETATGIIAGSPAFTAPEVLSGATPNPTSDIYALGATLFCALTGHAAFERRYGENVVAQFVRIANEPAPDLREQGIVDDISSVIEQAMSTSTENRPQSALAFGDALRVIRSNRGTGDGVEIAHTRSEVDSDRRPPTLPSHRGKGNLALELSSFVGRRRELTEARKLLSHSRILTLTGVGGVGKTRLALRLATSVQREFADGAWFVELDEVHTSARLIDVVAANLGVRDQLDRSRRRVLEDYLSSKKLLLVLDNCEQAVDAVAEIVTALLQQNRNLTILATSREPLAVEGETALRVPPLAVPDPDHEPSLKGLPGYDAVSLFAERATTAVPTFTLTEGNKSAVSRICFKLDGLPLPIELAAARLRAMSPEQILHRLSDRYALLTRGNRGAPSRQQTLRLCVDWSYDLCTPLEQRMWEQLSVFTGGFELDAAEYVCGETQDPVVVLDSMTSLVDKSIVVREEDGGSVRFRLLETLRAYGREKAQRNGAYHNLRLRHRDWFLQLAQVAENEFIGPRQVDWITRINREQPNLREAMEFCLAQNETETGLQIATSVSIFWGQRGLLHEARSWLDQFLSRRQEHPTIVSVRALYIDCMMTAQQQNHERAAALVEQARTNAERLADPTALAIVDHADGVVGLFTGDLARAALTIEAAWAVFRESGNELALQIESQILLAMAYQAIDQEAERTIKCLEEVLEITRVRGEFVYRSYALCAMALVQWRLGNRSHAIELLEQGLGLARTVDDPVGCANCIELLAWIVGFSEPVRASTLMGAAEALGRTAGSSAVFIPNLLVHHDECERVTRRALTATGFEKARQHGMGMALNSAVAYALGEQPSSVEVSESVRLTKREQQVADLVAQGLTNKAIASRLVISQRTAQGHVEHILTKFGFTSRAQIAAWVAERR